ncbi:hypothetical protein [Paraflavitalea speifideaquila]|uniref:hypothetical protein n=1 Tax=Paraflavitalea speifideaquila TaxID=3076558 RepID=UPI0028EE30D2|nr:hypothetical protein [Paraflavitalea speifideiaquila]
MSTKRPYDITKDFRPTGCKAIDQVASCIIFYQQRCIALKAIHLKEPYYSWFKMGLEVLNGRPMLEGEEMAFNGIDIEKGSRFQTDPILPERWPVSREDVMNPQ